MKNYREKIRTNAILPFIVAPLWLLVTGCGREQVQVYQVSNDAPTLQAAATPPPNITAGDSSSMSAQAMPAGSVSPDTSAGLVTWTTPANWTQTAATAMRVGSFKISGSNAQEAEVSIVPLAGMAGGDFANVNRWRGQVGLPSAADDVLQAAAENVDAGGQPAGLYDVAGTNSLSGEVNRIIAVIQHREGTTWFVKMTGDANLVEQQKPVFVDFLKSLSFTSQASGQPGASGMGAQGQAALPPGHPAFGDMSTPADAGPISHDGQPNWQVPAGWKEVSGGQFLTAKFVLNGADGAMANVNVSSAPGDGGGLVPNINRWRGQLGLQPATDVSAVTFSLPGGQGQIVNFTGTSAQTGKPAEIQAVVVTQPDRTWFYKLMGDPALVEAQKDAFTDFVKSAKY
jgi:hypothetical protein